MLLFFLLFFFLSQSALQTHAAPNTLFTQYRTDYLYQYSLYQNAYRDYLSKKDIHTQYQSPVTEADVVNATKSALITRNTSLRAYLQALRVYLDDYKSANTTNTDKTQIELSKWEQWLGEQNTIVSAFNNSGDIRTWTENFQTKYTSIQQTLYTALVLQDINLRLTILDELKALATEIQALPGITPENLQWLSTVRVKYDLINGSLNSAYSFTQKKQSSTRFSEFYPDSQAEIIKATNYIVEIVNNLQTIIPHD